MDLSNTIKEIDNKKVDNKETIKKDKNTDKKPNQKNDSNVNPLDWYHKTQEGKDALNDLDNIFFY